MKKVLSCLLAVLLLASLCATAVAAPVPSVEAEPLVPIVIEAIDDDGDDVTGGIVITPYEDKEKVEKLPKEAQEQLEKAAKALKDLDALIEGNDDLKELLAGAEVDAESLFDISVVGDDIKLPVRLRLKLVNPEHFAALLYFVDGEPTVIDTTLDLEEEKELSMVLEKVGSYAVLSFVDAE